MSDPTFRLLDVPGEQGRTSVSLLGSLAAHLATLVATSGSDAVGSITAGYAALGRAAGLTAEGARMRDAIERSQAGANGEAIWRALKIDTWVSSLPPAAVLGQFHNDVALLAADDLTQALELPLAPAEPHGAADAPLPEPSEFADYLVGMWVFGQLAVRAIEGLVSDELARSPVVVEGGDSPSAVSPGPLLR
jgi:hypothetical protein